MLLIFSAESVFAQKAEAIDFYNTCNLTVQFCHKKTTLINRRLNFRKLGKEAARGAVSGTASYYADVIGFAADMKMINTNCSDRLVIKNGNAAGG